MRTITDMPLVRKAKGTGQKAREQFRRSAITRLPQIAQVVANTNRISRKAAKHIPEDTKRGFSDGRKDGRKVVESIPYAVGYGAGASFDVSEGIVAADAYPFKAIFGSGERAVEATQE